MSTSRGSASWEGARIGWHPLDPPGPHAAIPVFARLVASGLLPREYAIDALLHAAERLRKPGASASGLQARLVQNLDDAARAHERLRDRTETDVRRAVLPAILRRRLRAELLALAADADPDSALHRREHLALIETEIAWAMRTGALAIRPLHAP